jgi:eukaryotic-like serine/threonine-protein kinase
MPFIDQLKAILGTGRMNVSSRFALLREAIQGTMSDFYMARDLRTNKIVGLKILDPKKTAEFEARFKGLTKPTEGEISLLIKHPRIVETLEIGITTEGAQYLVMEFLEGTTLHSALVARDPHFEGRRVKFIREAAEALAAVHAAGYIHRDVCPRNFILTNEGDDIKLIDFGLTVPATKEFMQPGNRTGTPNYMAPELVRRRATDNRLDIFAFGVTAYEICTYELPWQRGTDGMAAMTHDRPPADIHRYRPQINPVLAKAIHYCIEPDLNQRCPSLEKFLFLIRDVKHEDQK